MKRILLVVGCAALLTGCVAYGYRPYSYGYSYNDNPYYGYGPTAEVAAIAPIWYDNYYGPFYDGYWGPEGGFYFSEGHGRPFRRDVGGHFRREAMAGFHMVAGGRSYRRK